MSDSTWGGRLADAEEGGERRLAGAGAAVRNEVAEARQPPRQLHARERQQRQRVLDVGVDEARRLDAHAGLLLRSEERRVRRELRAAAAKRIEAVLRRGDDELPAEDRPVELDLREHVRRG